MANPGTVAQNPQAPTKTAARGVGVAVGGDDDDGAAVDGSAAPFVHVDPPPPQPALAISAAIAATLPRHDSGAMVPPAGPTAPNIVVGARRSSVDTAPTA
jgi:hypothetical protein